MNVFFLAVLMAAPVTAKEKYAAGEDTVKLVDYFLKTDTSELDVEVIPTFLSLMPETLPARQRDHYRAKRAELLALKKFADAKGKPPIRRAGEEPDVQCEIDEAKPLIMNLIRRMGFVEIEEHEEKWLEGQTRCTMCELTKEFTLTMFKEKLPVKGKRKVYYFVHQKDPLTALLSRYRAAEDGSSGTDFFSATGFVAACR